LHNLLYYIYTGTANLESTWGFLDTLPEGFPAQADPFRLSQVAHNLQLTGLEEDCAYELKKGVTIDNVAERLFHPVCRDNHELRELFLNFLLKNYDKVKDTEGWETTVHGFDVESESSSVRKYRMHLFHDISKRVKAA
jgi:hypothetical protein